MTYITNIGSDINDISAFCRDLLHLPMHSLPTKLFGVSTLSKFMSLFQLTSPQHLSFSGLGFLYEVSCHWRYLVEALLFWISLILVE